jgi:hypothetical protein
VRSVDDIQEPAGDAAEHLVRREFGLGGMVGGKSKKDYTPPSQAGQAACALAVLLVLIFLKCLLICNQRHNNLKKC